MNDPVVDQLRRAGCVFAEDEAALLRTHVADADEVQRLVALRVAGNPLEHVLGWVEFCGWRFQVDAGVFVPRRRTEALALRAAALAAVATGLRAAPPVVVDLCCGGAAIGAAIARAVPGIELHVADLDPDALRSARRNVEPAGGQVHIGDLDQALPPDLRGRVDVLVANVPYVPTAALPFLPAEARDHEPRYTHDGGYDGLRVARRLVAVAGGWLVPSSGFVLIEAGKDQANPLAAAMTFASLTPIVVSSAEATIVMGRSSPNRPS